MNNNNNKTYSNFIKLITLFIITLATVLIVLLYLKSNKKDEKNNNKKIDNGVNQVEKVKNKTNTKKEVKAEEKEIKEEVLETEPLETVEENQTTNEVIVNNNDDKKNENTKTVSDKKTDTTKTDSKKTETQKTDNKKTNTITKTTEKTVTKQEEVVVSDSFVIPDKYNTGNYYGVPLKKYTVGDSFYGLDVRESPKGVAVINFSNPKNKVDYLVIENYDFTNYYKLSFLKSDDNKKIKVILRNCKIRELFTNPDLNDNISLEFYNCEIESFSGSNSYFDSCKFGHGEYDALSPFKNVTVNYSYISDIAAYHIAGERHYDGIQIAGSNTISDDITHNIHILNSRFETPFTIETRNGVPSLSYVNAPLMLALEHSDGDNISFENLYINGGGYSVYAGTNHKPNRKKDTHISNASLKDIHVGYGHLYNILYPMHEDDLPFITITNVAHYDKLIVASVWKDSKIHVSTSNDTLIERKLVCKTNNGSYEFTINAHPKLTKANSVNYSFSSMPYDIDIQIDDASAKYVKCYDNTDGKMELIRTQAF